MQQGNIVNNMLEIVMQHRLAIKHDHEGLVTVRINIGRRMAKPMHILQSCALRRFCWVHALAYIRK